MFERLIFVNIFPVIWLQNSGPRGEPAIPYYSGNRENAVYIFPTGGLFVNRPFNLYATEG